MALCLCFRSRHVLSHQLLPPSQAKPRHSKRAGILQTLQQFKSGGKFLSNVFPVDVTTDILQKQGIKQNLYCMYLAYGGHGGRVVTLSPPTSEAEVRFLARPQVGKLVVCLPLIGSLQYRTLMNCMYWFPLPFQLPVVI